MAYIPSNSFLASSNFTSCRRLALISSSMSEISALSLSACSRTTSTGVFFFQGLRPSGLTGAGFGSFCFGAGIVMLLVELLLLLVDPNLEFPDGFPLSRQLDVGVRCVNFRARRMAHERHANFLQDAGLHQTRVEGMAKIVEAHMADPGVFERGFPRTLDDADLLAFVSEDNSLVAAILCEPLEQPPA